jgi:hypothetical protein
VSPPPIPPRPGVTGGVKGVTAGGAGFRATAGRGAAFFMAAFFLGAACFFGAALCFAATFLWAGLQLMQDFLAMAFFRAGFRAIAFFPRFAVFFARFFAKLSPPFSPVPDPTNPWSMQQHAIIEHSSRKTASDSGNLVKRFDAAGIGPL